MKKWIFIILIVFVLLVGFAFLASRGDKISEDNDGENGEDIEVRADSEESEVISEELKGVSLSPKSFQSEDFADFFNKADEVGDAVTGWAEIEEISKENSVPAVVAGLASQYNYEPVILIGLKNVQSAEPYKNSLKDFVEKYDVKYLGLGVEVNRYSDFSKYASIYNELYVSVKEISPSTNVFPVFQYEQMKGLQGGLFGSENNPANAEWKLLENLNYDVIGFTTYPGLIYKEPSEIPSNYYSEIQEHVSKPVLFTEIGWFRENNIAGWESSAEEQVEFIEKYLVLTKEIDIKLNIWTFLYDPDVAEEEIFKTMGLLRDNEETSFAFETWKNQ